MNWYQQGKREELSSQREAKKRRGFSCYTDISVILVGIIYRNQCEILGRHIIF